MAGHALVELYFFAVDSGGAATAQTPTVGLVEMQPPSCVKVAAYSHALGAGDAPNLAAIVPFELAIAAVAGQAPLSQQADQPTRRKEGNAPESICAVRGRATLPTHL